MAATAEPPSDVRRGGHPPETPTGDGGDGDPSPGDRGRWVTLASFLHPAEAHIARLRLEAAGVACVLLDEMMAATNCLALAIGGVKLQVPAADAERAGILLRRFMPEMVPPLASYRTRKLATMAACVAEAVGGVVTLSDCGASWSLRVEAEGEVAAARALADSPFGGGLSDIGFHLLARQPCLSCGGNRSRTDWHRALAHGPRGDAGRLRGWLAATVARRHCRTCGTRW